MPETTKPSSDLVPFDGYAVAKQDPSALLSVLRENVGPGALSVFDLERVKVPTGGGALWSIPTLEGTPDDVRTLDGIIVYHREPRAYWKVPFDQSGGGTPPDCSSSHGETGIGEPGGACDVCPHAQWGSKPLGPGAKAGDVSRGQACKQMKLVALLRPDALLPLAIFLPPTSIVPMRKYLLGLASRAKHFSSVVTRLTLTKASSGAGIEYSQAAPSMLSTLSPDEEQRVRAYADAIRSTLDTITLTEEDVREPTSTA